MKKFPSLFFLFIFLTAYSTALTQPFTHADSLRGTYGNSRNWWDVLKYDIHVKFNIADSTISGYNLIKVKILKKGDLLQIDLQEPMIIDSIYYSSADQIHTNIDAMEITKDGNAYFIPARLFSVPHTNVPLINLFIYYHGKPRIAKNPPWDGGLIWKKDKSKNPWVSIACQGLGASVWYPCKDHQADEPDSASLSITCPDTLVAVGNGRYGGKTMNDDHSYVFMVRKFSD